MITSETRLCKDRRGPKEKRLTSFIEKGERHTVISEQKQDRNNTKGHAIVQGNYQRNTIEEVDKGGEKKTRGLQHYMALKKKKPTTREESGGSAFLQTQTRT